MLNYEDEEYYERMDREYDQFRDDLLTESYEDNCKRYGKHFVDMYMDRYAEEEVLECEDVI